MTSEQTKESPGSNKLSEKTTNDRMLTKYSSEYNSPSHYSASPANDSPVAHKSSHQQPQARASIDCPEIINSNKFDPRGIDSRPNSRYTDSADSFKSQPNSTRFNANRSPPRRSSTDNRSSGSPTFNGHSTNNSHYFDDDEKDASRSLYIGTYIWYFFSISSLFLCGNHYQLCNNSTKYKIFHEYSILCMDNYFKKYKRNLF